ncbi:MAG: HalOD1 output domain-containing protein [Haloarculaceae archaeon]
MTTDHGTQTARRYDWSETPPSYAVVETVARADGTDPVDLGPLYEQVDPDALDALLADARGVAVTFPFAGHEVTVGSDGVIEVD